MPAVGSPPENRKQTLIKLMWICIWMLYLGAPVTDLLHGGHTALGICVAGLGLALFIAVYLSLVFRLPSRYPSRWAVGALGALFGLSVVLSVLFGEEWLVLFVYVAVASGAALPGKHASAAIPVCTAAIPLIGLLTGASTRLWPSLVIPALLGGFAMTGVRQMVHTTRELRAARAAVARLAASEERLRLARDVHDLLGHSLSLIAVKSELAGRMLPGRPEQAAEQVADIERVSRQALVDVREAVSGYRRPTLEVELAGARTALAAAGVSAQLPEGEEHAEEEYGLSPDSEGALAWALREAVTNVVRHSGATRCTVTLAGQADGTVCLTVTDNGRGPDGTAGGNGLTGLAERLALADGALETGAGVRGGFTLRATVPSTAPAAGERAHVR
ncbi:sensor histidine kinase [Streptomyces sp. ODS28]|uniref:sensor histidine kinase n=1 Tax=Streptomyces sp. ODS28 TaxID=3136688 RepID=UPI0031E75C91